MSYVLFKNASFGPGRTGLLTVGYTLTGGTRTTSGIAEIGSGTGIYGALVTFADDFNGAILWDTGQGGSTVYASEEVNPPTVSPSPTPTPTPTPCPPPWHGRPPALQSALDEANESQAALMEAIASPRRVTSDAGSVESHSLPDLIAAMNYITSLAAAKNRRRGLRFNKLVPPGMVGKRAGELGGGYGNNDSWGITGGYPT